MLCLVFPQTPWSGMAWSTLFCSRTHRLHSAKHTILDRHLLLRQTSEAGVSLRILVCGQSPSQTPAYSQNKLEHRQGLPKKTERYKYPCKTVVLLLWWALALAQKSPFVVATVCSLYLLPVSVRLCRIPMAQCFWMPMQHPQETR